MKYFDPYGNRASGQYPEGMPEDTEGWLFPDSHETIDDYSLGQFSVAQRESVRSLLKLGVIGLGLYLVFKK